MGRLKLERLADLDKAKSRLAAIKSIDPVLDLGNGITAPLYETVITEFNKSLSDYNTALSKVDDYYNTCLTNLDTVKDWNERILTGVASKYGKKSSEYEMAGGTRKTEHRKQIKKDAGNV